MPGKLRVGRSADLGDRTYFFEIIPDLLVITGFDGYLRDVNTAWQSAVGWSRKELLAPPFLDFVHPEDRVRMASELEGVQKGIFMMFLESRFQCKDGTYKWFMWKAAGMPGRSKVYMLGREIVMGRDGHARGGRSDPALERRAAHLDMVQDWLGAGSWEIDLASMRFWWSDPMARLLGHLPSEAPATADDALQMLAPRDRERVLGAMRSALEAGHAEMECAVHCADGSELRLIGHVQAVRDKDGVAKALCGVMRRLPAQSEAARQALATRSSHAA